jgi:CubicO group peptidase (beta-lactamase class C family)
MTMTEFNPTPIMDERLAEPYDSDSTGRPMPAVRLRANVWPAGIVYGTVFDQANWLIMNLNGGVFKDHRFLKPETARAMQTRQYDKFVGPMAGGWGNETSGYGLTWWTMTKNGEHYIAHSGSVPGYTAFVHGNVDRRQGIVILTNGNRAHPYLVRIVNRATDLMTRHQVRFHLGCPPSRA